jgi:4-hydroxythreonine-4-phosphate dehydrogenase
MKKIAVTMGDPAGVGAEIIVKSLAAPEVRELCVPVVIGSSMIIEEALRLTGQTLETRLITSPADADPSPGTLNVIGTKTLSGFEKRKATAENGRACVDWIEKAVALALRKEVSAIVTAPISKESLRKAGYPWPGHTEMIAEMCGTRDFAMMLSGGPLRVILATIHTALRHVPALIKRDAVLRTIRLAKKACDMMSIASPRIAVAGLNPHAGEAGIFGDEEIQEIIPAIEDARREGIPCSGPYPPDTVFHKAYGGGVDIVVCMYHDQGLIPLKMIAFDEGVNITVGLPIIRTSPDHGTAYDIAWTGSANPSRI